MATSTSKGYPYPQSGDAVNVPNDIKNLADKVDANPGVAQLTTTARDALTGGDLWAGRVIYNTTTGKLQQYSGSAWADVDTTLALSSATPSALGVASAGSSSSASKGDHVHAMPSASDVSAIPTSALTSSNPAALGAAAAPGSSSNVARLDHVHAYPTAANVGAIATTALTSTNPEALGTAAPGTSSNVARLDHVHSSTVNNPTFTGVAQFPDGSASAPAITNTDDTNTGLHFPADDTVAISTGGTERLRVNASGNVGIGLIPGVKVHIGNDTAQAAVYVDSATNNGALHLRRANTSLTSPTVVASGDTLGVFDFAGYDGSAYRVAARIRSDVDATPGASDMPGRIGMWTCADGSATLTERLRIDSNGLITGTGTSLGAWTAYTPSWTSTGTAPSLGNGTITGHYVQLGKTVHFRIVLTLGSTSTVGTGAWTFNPPVTGTTANQNFLGTAFIWDVSATAAYTAILERSGATLFFLRSTGAASARVSGTAPFTFTPADADYVQITGTYEIA